MFIYTMNDCHILRPNDNNDRPLERCCWKYRPKNSALNIYIYTIYKPAHAIYTQHRAHSYSWLTNYILYLRNIVMPFQACTTHTHTFAASARRNKPWALAHLHEHRWWREDECSNVDCRYVWWWRWINSAPAGRTLHCAYVCAMLVWWVFIGKLRLMAKSKIGTFEIKQNES